MRERFIRPLSSWIKFAIWAIIYILFIVWVGNFWWLLLLPLIFDLFITNFIPWGFWRNFKNKTLVTIFSWLDAILFALVAVYFINLYLFQNYQIPSSSLEQTLKVGDFLAVSKCSYGPRIPNTPLSAPLVQHTFPWGSKSYLEKPQWEYRRLKGWDSVESGDIVVFNFPAGDSVPKNISNPDYYILSFQCAQTGVRATKFPKDAVLSYEQYNDCMRLGAKVIKDRSALYGDLLYRPVDRRENYVKRCVALPGEMLEVRDNALYINDNLVDEPEGVQHNYFVQTNGQQFSPDALHKLGVSVAETEAVDAASYAPYLSRIGMTPQNSGNWGAIYIMAMTEEVLAKVEQMPMVKQVKIERVLPEMHSPIYPLAYTYKWSRDNYGPLWVPAKGASIELTEDNILRYERCIVNYERNTLDYRDGVAYLNGEPATEYTFKMDYYWMMGDNRHNSADSRMWGFVPEDHVVGRPVFVWLSLDRDKGWFSGKIRWNRFGKDASR
ncbi:MAG: S26 family signal peptidase [bacterium]